LRSLCIRQRADDQENDEQNEVLHSLLFINGNNIS
jgi:hypothetical protein